MTIAGLLASLQRARRALAQPPGRTALSLFTNGTLRQIKDYGWVLCSPTTVSVAAQLSPDALHLFLGGSHAVTSGFERGVRRRHWLRRELLGLDQPVDFGLGSFHLGRGRSELGFSCHSCRGYLSGTQADGGREVQPAGRRRRLQRHQSTGTMPGARHGGDLRDLTLRASQPMLDPSPGHGLGAGVARAPAVTRVLLGGGTAALEFRTGAR